MTLNTLQDDLSLREQVIDAFQQEKFEPGEYIIKQHEPVDQKSKYFVLQSGECEVFVSKGGKVYRHERFWLLLASHHLPLYSTVPDRYESPNISIEPYGRNTNQLYQTTTGGPSRDPQCRRCLW